MKVKLTAIGALAACAAACLAAPAVAGTPYPTEVTIKEQNGDFNGKVKSQGEGVDLCLEDRKVTLMKQKSGDDQKINSDTTGPDGKWDTGNTHVGPGKYYAKAKQVKLMRKARGAVLCKKGKSNTVTVN